MEEVADYYPLGKLNFSDTGGNLTDFTINKEDRIILKELGKKKAQIAQDPINLEKISLWKDLNNLKKVRPLVWINEIPWHEMNVDGELNLETETRFSRYLETRLKRTI